MKIDLHTHGIIGFHDFWIERQTKGLGTNLLQLIAEECFRKDLGLCVITSQYEEGQIDDPETGLIHDRFGYLCREAERLPNEYDAKADSEGILLTVKKGNKKVGIVNSQSVGGRINGRRVDTIVVGGNRLPVAKPLDYVLDFALERGFINIGEHIKAPELFSIGEDIKNYLDKYHALEWNAQMVVPYWMRYVPIIGKQIRSACRTNNKEVIQYAQTIGKPIVAVSDAHRIKDIGVANIEIQGDEENLVNSDIRNCNGLGVLLDLQNIISLNRFNNNFNTQPFLGLIKWRGIYSEGVRVYLGDQNLPEGQRQAGDLRLGNKSLYLKGFLKKPR